VVNLVIGWQSAPRLVDFGDTYHEPTDEELSWAPFLLTATSLRFTVPSDQFPTRKVERLTMRSL